MDLPEPRTRVTIVNPATDKIVAKGRILDYVSSRFGRLVRLKGDRRRAWSVSWIRTYPDSPKGALALLVDADIGLDVTDLEGAHVRPD